MEGSDYLLTSAEVSVALAGFTALVVVLRQGTPRGIPAGLVISLVERSLVSTVLSLLPVLLSGLSVPPSHLWFTSSGLLGLYVASLAWRGATLRRREPAAAEMISGPAFLLLFALGPLVVILQIANAVGIGVEQSVWWYLVGLTWVLSSVCYLFYFAIRSWARAA